MTVNSATNCSAKINQQAFFPPGLHPEAVNDLRLAPGGGELPAFFDRLKLVGIGLLSTNRGDK